MVCIPCIVIPFFLFIFHRFIRPYLLKLWSPLKTVDDKPTEEKNGVGNNLKCPILSIKKQDYENENDVLSTTNGTVLGSVDKKND